MNGIVEESKGNKKGFLDNDFFDEEMDVCIGEVVSRSKYNLLLGFCIILGIFINALEVTFMGEFFAQIHPFVFLILYFALSFLGIWIVRKSKSVILGLVGYMFVVLPVGGSLCSICGHYMLESILMAMWTTFGITVLLCIAGALFPKFFLSLGKTLFICLLSYFVVQILMVLGMFLFKWYSASFDILISGLGVLLFTLYIGYDYSRSQHVPATYNNAIGCAVGIYLDIVNLFVLLLRIFGRRK